MQTLLVQKPSSKSKSKYHSEALKRRLVFWNKGGLKELMRETETIQLRLVIHAHQQHCSSFKEACNSGKLNAAVKLLASSMEGGILPLDQTTMTLIQSKHPELSDLNEDAVI